MNIGVRELKQHLSDYLDRAAAGEHVVVTDRGIPKVLIVPIPGEGQLERGISEGWIRPAARSGGLVPFARVSSPARVLDLLDDDRDG